MSMVMETLRSGAAKLPILMQKFLAWEMLVLFSCSHLVSNSKKLVILTSKCEGGPCEAVSGPSSQLISVGLFSTKSKRAGPSDIRVCFFFFWNGELSLELALTSRREKDGSNDGTRQWHANLMPSHAPARSPGPTQTRTWQYRSRPALGVRPPLYRAYIAPFEAIRERWAHEDGTRCHRESLVLLPTGRGLT